jgi:hypothetical protein
LDQDPAFFIFRSGIWDNVTGFERFPCVVLIRIEGTSVGS